MKKVQLLLLILLSGCASSPHTSTLIACDPFCFLQVSPPKRKVDCLVIDGKDLKECQFSKEAN